MAKKRDTKKKDEEAQLPKFDGFHPLAAGLGGFKAKLDEETKANDDKRKAAAARGVPLPAPLAPRPAPPSPPTAEHRSKTSDDDDQMSFHRMMSGVQPLDTGTRSRVPKNADVRAVSPQAKAAEMKARAQVEAEQALAHLHAIVDGAASFEVSDDGKRVEGRRVETAPDLVRSLRRGSLPIDGRVDLHGLTALQAQTQLVEFLRTMRSRNERCVLVIHGKGEHSVGGGVLRGEIAAWLSQGKAREHVTAFTTARDEDGGEGALYVALRR